MNASNLVARSAAIAFGLVVCSCPVVAANEVDWIEVNDERLSMSVYVSDPDIVTPVGAAVDAEGRLFVVESHTHLRPAGYSGPVHDKIKVFWGETAEGRAAHSAVFADGIDEAMNVAFSPDGTLYVCTAKAVYALPDSDRDGKADRHIPILRLENGQTYPHNQLLALTFSPDNWLYVTRGNVAGMPYSILGTDGQSVSGYGDGGEVVRCRPDGTGVEKFATGFWNAFDLKFDREGNLLLVDNDPDSRGPNRLVQLVKGGDYGYKALYGGSGIHPYQAWNGELPGTLPYAGGVGEAPSGLLDARLSGLPQDYAGSILVTIWGEHEITRHVIAETDGLIKAVEKPFIKGGSEFRPVALAPSPDGSIFITDWVLKDYPNHGRGRIWRLRAKAGNRSVQTLPDVVKRNLVDMSGASSALEQYEILKRAAVSENVFRRHEAVQKMKAPEYRSFVAADLRHADSNVRRAAFLAFGPLASDKSQDSIVKLGLQDPDADIRIIALLAVGTAVRKDMEGAVRESAHVKDIPMRLFEVWLATMQILRSDADRAYAERVPGSRIKRDVDSALIDELVTETSWPPAVRAFAIARLNDPDRPKIRSALLKCLRESHDRVVSEAIRTLALSPAPDVVSELQRLSKDPSTSNNVRAEAISALERAGDDSFLTLVSDPEPDISLQALRSLRSRAGDPAIRSKLEAIRNSWNRDARFAAVKRILDELIDETAKRPELSEVSAWQEAARSGGDAGAGRRVFFASSMMCSACHRIEGRGGVIGPDLSLIGRTVDRNKLVHSILRPSDEVAPQFQGWEVRKKSGEVVAGLQAHIRGGGNVSIIPFDGVEILIPKNEVEGLQAMTTSLMPDGTTAQLSVDEFRDLIAFLEACR